MSSEVTCYISLYHSDEGFLQFMIGNGILTYYYDNPVSNLRPYFSSIGRSIDGYGERFAIGYKLNSVILSRKDEMFLLGGPRITVLEEM